jgi:hypothetical protein
MYKKIELVTSSGYSLLSNTEAYISSNCVRIPGPKVKMLFVLVDVMTENVDVHMTVGTIGGPVGVVFPTNRIAGGANRDITAQVDNIRQGLADRGCTPWQAAYRRWVSFCANDQDMRVANFLAAETYSLFPKPFKRVVNQMEGAEWYPFIGAPASNPPFTTDYTIPNAEMEGIIVEESAWMWMTPHARTSVPIGGARQGAINFKISPMDPGVYIGMCAKFYLPAGQCGTLFNKNALGSLALGWYIENEAWASGVDFACQKMGVSDRLWWVGVDEDHDGGGELLNKMAFKLDKMQAEALTFGKLRLAWTSNTVSREWWEEVFTLARDGNTLARVPSPIAERWIGKQLLSREGGTTFGELDYDSYYMDGADGKSAIGYFDVFQWKYGDIAKVPGNITFTQAVGKFTPNITNLNNGVYLERGDKNRNCRSICMVSPCHGVCHEQKWGQRNTGRSGVLEFPIVSLPVTINYNSHAVVWLGYRGARNRMGGRVSLDETLFFLSSRFSSEFFAPKRDTNTVKSKDIDDVLDFTF